MSASELYQSGQLPAAVEAALDAVRKNPSDLSARYLLGELLCFAGDLERADKQFDTLSKQWLDAALQISLVRHLIRAEKARQEFRLEGRLPEFVNNEVPAHLQLHLRAAIAIREGNPAEAHALLQEAEAQRPSVAGTCNGQPFDDLRDLDDLCAPFLEAFTGTGKYYWIPWNRIESMQLEKPTRPLDLLWRKTSITVTNGPDGDVYLPTLYLQTTPECDSQLRLGRGTDWQGHEGEPVLGRGLRMWLFGDQEQSILQVHQIEIHPAQ